MRIDDFILTVQKLYEAQTGDQVEMFKLGAYAFDDLKKEMGVTHDDNWIDFPNPDVVVELRSVGVDRLIVEWGDGAQPFEFLVGGIRAGTVTPQHAIDFWKKQPLPPTPANSPITIRLPSNFNVSGNYVFSQGLIGLKAFSDDTTIAAPTVKTCAHSWQKYQGLNQIDYTCSKCNERRDSIA